jgi:phosphomevalonate kinase
MRLSVPANLLLLGEYAVTEPGGLGIALAIEPRVSAISAPAGSPLLVGLSERGEARWPGAQAGLLEAVAQAVLAHLRERGIRELPAVEVVVDSRLLPKGYGSSAAVAVAVSAALLSRAGLEGGDLAAACSHAALVAHRSFQGGRGSGYDVAASLNGGIGLFEGGREPSWTPLSLDWLVPLSLFRGKAPVLTSDAVARYQEWKRRDPAAASDFLAASNRAVAGFARAGGWEKGVPWLEAARALGLELGRAIGVSAEIKPPGAAAGLCKAVGAGNELGVLAEHASATLSALTIARRGLVIEDEA